MNYGCDPKTNGTNGRRTKAILLGPWFPLDSRGLEQGLGEGLEGYLMNLAR